MDQISSLAFHRRRGVLLIAQSAPKDQASIKAVVPSQLPDANRHHMTPRFRMGEGEFYDIKVALSTLMKWQNLI